MLTNFQSKNLKKTASQLVVSSVMVTYMASSSAMAQEKVKKLSEITVKEVTEEKSKYNNTKSSFGKITSDLKDTPKTITSISEELMDDQAVHTLRDALRNVPGISIAAGEGGNQGDNFSIRGFSARNDMYVDGMRDFGHYNRDPFSLETVEVIKGPSSVLVGRGSTGGIINQQTKEAHLGDANKSSIALGTNETMRFTTDVNKQLSDTSAFRINLMAHSSEVEDRDEIQDGRFGIAPSLAFGLGTDTRFKLDYLHQNSDSIPDYGVGFLNGRAAKVDRSTFYGFTTDFFRTKADIATAKFEHDFNDDLSISNNLRYARYTREIVVGNPSQQTNGTVNRSLVNNDSKEQMLSNQTNLAAKFETFGIKHDSMSGVELSRESTEPLRFTYSGVPAALRVPTSYGPASFTSKTLDSDSKGTVETVGVYFSDTAHLTDKLDLLGSVRYEHVKSNQKTFFSSTAPSGPKASLNATDDLISWSAGINYKLTDNGSVYASTGTSFDISASGLSLSTTATNFEPDKAKTYEVGTKWDFFDKKLSANFAIFRTDKTNVRETVNSITELAGRQVVDGFEVGLSGNLTDQWKIFTGYAYMDAKVRQTANTTPGATLAGAPRHSYNLFTTYRLPFDLEVGGGVNYVSERNASTVVNTNTINKAPGYTTYNAMAKYYINDKIDVQLNVENLTNKYYFDQVSGGRAVPGEGRVFMLTTNFSL